MEKKIIAIGHIDEGKTTFINSVRSIIGQKELSDGVPEEVSFKIEENGYLLFAYPGHADYCEKIGEKGEEYAILVCSAMDGLMPEAIEQVKICKEKGIKKVAVFISMCDIVDDKDLIDFTADDIAEMLEENGYDGNCPFAKGDSFAVLEGGEEFKKKYTKILTEFLFDCHDWFNK